MKILNEGNLAHFATGSAAVDKEGWLMKKSDVGKSYNRRWVVLKGNLLFYFERQLDKDPHGVIILEGHTVELSDSDPEQFGFQVSFRTAGGSRRYVFVAESSDLMESWMKAITCSSYAYMRAVLAGLQSQLEGLDSQEMEAALSAGSSPSTQPPLSSTPENGPLAGPHRNIPNGGDGFTTDTGLAADQSTASPRQIRRRNPFNTNSMNDCLDVFGQAPFGSGQPSTSSLSAAAQPAVVPKVGPSIVDTTVNVSEQPAAPARSKKLRGKKASTFYTESKSETILGLSGESSQSSRSTAGVPESNFYVPQFKGSRFLELHELYRREIRAAIEAYTALASKGVSAIVATVTAAERARLNGESELVTGSADTIHNTAEPCLIDLN